MTKEIHVLIGNLGRDPEMRYMPDGQPVTSINIATERRWTDRNTDEKMKDTTWHRISIFGKQGENANKYLRKGSKVLVECRPYKDKKTGGPRVWEDNAGNHRANFEWIATSVTYLSSGNGNGQAAQAPEPEYVPADPPPEDEFPF